MHFGCHTWEGFHFAQAYDRQTSNDKQRRPVLPNGGGGRGGIAPTVFCGWHCFFFSLGLSEIEFQRWTRITQTFIRWFLMQKIESMISGKPTKQVKTEEKEGMQDSSSNRKVPVDKTTVERLADKAEVDILFWSQRELSLIFYHLCQNFALFV